MDKVKWQVEIQKQIDQEMDGEDKTRRDIMMDRLNRSRQK